MLEMISFEFYESALKAYMKDCLKHCRIPTWEEWSDYQSELKESLKAYMRVSSDAIMELTWERWIEYQIQLEEE